jgi:hypothetical protein
VNFDIGVCLEVGVFNIEEFTASGTIGLHFSHGGSIRGLKCLEEAKIIIIKLKEWNKLKFQILF